MLSVVLFVVVVAGVAYSAPTMPSEPKKCCFDKQYSAVLGDIGAVSNPGGVFYIDGVTSIAYDFYQQKTRSYTRLKNSYGTTDIIRDVLTDYANGVTYTTDENNNCTSGPLQPFDFILSDGCIPDHATYLGPATFGYRMYTLNVHTWSFTMPSGWEVLMSVTQQHCVPVVEIMFGNLNGSPIEETLFFTGYRPSVDANVSFVPPANCPRATETAPVGRRSIKLY